MPLYSWTHRSTPTDMLSTCTNSTKHPTLFPFLAGQDEGLHIHTYMVQTQLLASAYTSPQRSSSTPFSGTDPHTDTLFPPSPHTVYAVPQQLALNMQSIQQLAVLGSSILPGPSPLETHIPVCTLSSWQVVTTPLVSPVSKYRCLVLRDRQTHKQVSQLFLQQLVRSLHSLPVLWSYCCKSEMCTPLAPRTLHLLVSCLT